MMQNDLFDTIAPAMEELAPGVFLFRSYVDEELFLDVVKNVTAEIPFRHMVTPGGKKINVAGSSMGKCGWYSDRKGYRYEMSDPITGKNWPDIPQNINNIISKAAAKAGFNNFVADSCFINRYEPGVRLTAHIDQDEQDFDQPIVSVSLGVSAIFQIFGETRGGKPLNIPLHSGDLLIFGGPARRLYHGVKKLETAHHPKTGNKRINLTFRKAL
ncbi:alpha-ketoglutarate-dependent dioxygenase AlkB [Pseudemcibacter aquimaris]|uniref:alpha-ketoglutarate-dependent dioxygenase AlkB n=1 Tax=Pseudemcibacter aquimaris TaxID=2857064 RepID=UPI002010D1B0|nr:alpha-ketoglutarate-dependent dioxygenase AlkB [Pseudemcibacter aquimaris]MCC3861154.1 alpha-ketoglutarate-dependent dioxygenase AlkB [Pseudemcibacter aquimaris]WDU59971.1 alpha-ketoglutarate-dependent dioxygenase AlkB [Pseudemcibacter aquimaris]